MWDWSKVPKYQIKPHTDKRSGKTTYVIYQHSGFGDMMLVCECKQWENANAILEILYKDMEENNNDY